MSPKVCTLLNILCERTSVSMAPRPSCYTLGRRLQASWHVKRHHQSSERASCRSIIHNLNAAAASDKKSGNNIAGLRYDGGCIIRDSCAMRSVAAIVYLQPSK